MKLTAEINLHCAARSCKFMENCGRVFVVHVKKKVLKRGTIINHYQMLAVTCSNQQQ